MSHKNYSAFSENTTETVTTEPTIEPVVIEDVITENETVEIPEVVDSTGNTTEDVAGESIEAPKAEEPEVTEEPKAEEPEVTEEPKTELKGIGIVSGCKKLNVRAEASIDAEIITVISAGTEVVIEDTESAEDEFYKISTVDNKIGYCMKKFIVIK